MLKIVTLMNAAPDSRSRIFRIILRNTYGPLAAKGPRLRRYVQSCALPQGYGWGELLFDAIGEMWFDWAIAYEEYRHRRSSPRRARTKPRSSTPRAPW